MAIILKYKVSTTIGTVILMAVLTLCIVTITNRAFSDSYGEIESSQRSQLDLIKGATGMDLDKSNIANWNIYSNTEYGFSIKYPETLAQADAENKKTYSEDHSGALIRPLKINFENFSIKVWSNSGGQELVKFLAGDDVCVYEAAFCRSNKRIDEIDLVKITISDKGWFQPKDKTQRFFIPSPDNKYFFDFELTNSKQEKEFKKVISTLEFIK